MQSSQINIKSSNTAKFETIEILRGLAALAVALFHLTDYGKDSYLNSIPLFIGLIPKYGWVAIGVFFVISGFVIPYSLWRKNFQLKSDWYSSLSKRIIRIYPAYLTTILLIIGLFLFALFISKFQATDPSITPLNIFLHLFFLNDLIHAGPAMSPVFWTLAIDLQYYLLIICLFPLINSTKTVYKLILLVIAYGLPFLLTDKSLVFSWLLLFNLGTIGFQLISQKINLLQYVLITSITCLLLFLNKGLLYTSVGLESAILIVFVRSPKISLFTFLGTISYSFYLVHCTIGFRIINVISRFGQGELIKIIGVVIALIGSFIVAYLMHKYIETPTQNYFKHIK
jgi:peptidoglycan/LPS O-acetylase OafA/YrhL